MKLIIDIPEYAYEHIREYYEKNDTVESTYSYIYHGTPIPDNATVCDIEQIRAEIEELDRYYDNDYFSTNNCPMYKCNEVLLIIDKYRAESEDKAIIDG